MTAASTASETARFEAPRAGDAMVLCSDGLCGPISDEKLLELVAGAPNLPTATQALIDAANENGGPDNITCVIARWIE